MSAINIHIEMPQHTKFDMETFKMRVQEYANMLCVVMSNDITADTTIHSKAKDKTDALSFIQSLAVPGGENVPADINPVDCLIDAKYGK